MKTTKIAALQLSTLPMSEAKLDYYVKICSKNNVSLIVLGEYVLNSFFKELEKIPTPMIKEQTKHKIEVLKKLAKKYNVTIVAPIVMFKKESLIKAVMRATPNAIYSYEQNFLINYKHWNEDAFFSKNIEKVDIPVFLHDNVRVSIMCGFDTHFDVLWQLVRKKRVDVVLIPTVNAFESSERWRELIKVRSFLNNVYILRVNRIGSFKNKDSSWHFYGNSLICSPNGAIEEMLSDKEGMLICDIDSQLISESKKSWGFRTQLLKRNLI